MSSKSARIRVDSFAAGRQSGALIIFPLPDMVVPGQIFLLPGGAREDIPSAWKGGTLTDLPSSQAVVVQAFFES
ncbi:hypothetical protein Dimus_021963 [Dionaea muscipula]